MKAVVKYGQEPDNVELRDVPEPTVQPGTVLVEVQAVGVCGWDVEMWKHSMANPVSVPVVQGHEFCGLIAEVGEGVTNWKVGGRVACETSAVVCGQCECCRSGDYQLCPDRKGFGYGIDGAFTRLVVVRQEILHHVPEHLSDQEAALTEPFCVGYHALVRQVRVNPGDTVLVLGPGPIGLICLQVARVLGAAQTILVGVGGDEQRMEHAVKHGWADHTLRADEQDVPQVVTDLTGGRGADVVADCAGSSPATKTALYSVRRGGQIVKVGWGPKPFDHSLDELLRRSATLVGTFGHNWEDWEAVLALLGAGRLDAKAMITDVWPLERWHEAFERVEDRKAIKMILVVQRHLAIDFLGWSALKLRVVKGLSD